MKIDRNTTVQETGERKILPAGEYRFKVESATYKMSRTNSPMWEVQLSFPDEPDAKWVYDYFPETEKSAWKFGQFFDSIGEPGDDTDAMKYAYGEEGIVRLIVEHNEVYGDKNKARAYIRKQEAPAEKGGNEDLPF